MEKLFMSHGFNVDIIAFDEIAENLGAESTADDYNNILFVAEHLRYSDDQVRSFLYVQWYTMHDTPISFVELVVKYSSKQAV